MRYGICLANFGTYGDPRNVLAIAEEAEAAGWEALLVWDHLSFVWGPPAADPWVTLAAVAARTERLILGTNLTPLPRRRPHVLAHQVATLDVLSGGRTVFAAGIGGVESEFAAFGEPDGRAAPRGDARRGARRAARPLVGRAGHPPREALRGRRRRVEAEAGAGADPDLDRREQSGRPPPGGAFRRVGGGHVRTSGLMTLVSPDELAEKVAELTFSGRGTKAPFDVVVFGQTPWHGDGRLPRAYEAAGATRWLEYFHDASRDLRNHDTQEDRSRRAGLVCESAEHPPEERVPPGRLRERAPVEERRHPGLAACGVVTVDQPAERAQRHVLGDASETGGTGSATAPPRRARTRAPLHRAARVRRPPVPPRDGLAEQRDVRVVAAEDPLVERLLRRPDGSRSRSGRCCPPPHCAYSGVRCPKVTPSTGPRAGSSRSSASTSRSRRRIRARARRLAERLDGRRLLSVEAVGKNLLLTFEGGLVLRSHLRMYGRWTVVPAAAVLPRPALARAPRHRARGRLWNGPVLELHTRAVRRLGPDILADPPELDACSPTGGDAAARGRRRAPRSAARRRHREQVEGGGTLGGGAFAVARGLPRPDEELHAVLDAAAQSMRDSLDGRPPATASTASSAVPAPAAAGRSARAVRETTTGSPTGAPAAR